MSKKNGNTEVNGAKKHSVVISLPEGTRVRYQTAAGLIPLSRWVKGMVEAALDQGLPPKPF
jgi:hypothetical protein